MLSGTWKSKFCLSINFYLTSGKIMKEINIRFKKNHDVIVSFTLREILHTKE